MDANEQFIAKADLYKVKIYDGGTGKYFKVLIAAYSMEEAIKLADQLSNGGYVEWAKDIFDQVYYFRNKFE